MASGELPTGHYVTCKIRLDPDAGGETRAALMRNRIFAQAGAVDLSMLTFDAAPDYAKRRALLVERGLLLPQTSLLNLYDHYRLNGWRESEPTGAALEDLGPHKVREQARPDGSPWRVVYRPPAAPETYDYLRPDGSVYVRLPAFDFRRARSWPRNIRQVAPSGEVIGAFDSLGEWFRSWLRELTDDDDRAFVFVESRGLAPHLAPLSRDPRLHLICLLHNMHLSEPRRWDSRILGETHARLLNRIPEMDAFVTLTERQRHDIALRRGATDNLFVVPNPVDLPVAPAKEVTRDPRRVAVVSRLVPQKRLGDAVRAFARVAEAVPGVHFDIYGHGPRSASLARLARELGVEDSVSLHGHHPNAREALWRATAMIMTSSYEGYPLAVLESMSHGCPVVSYDVKYGPREQITDGVDGYLVPAGDRTALADRLIELLRSPELARRMSLAALEKAKQHDTQAYLSDWVAILEKTVQMKPRRTRLAGADLEVQRLSGVRRGRDLLGRRSAARLDRFAPSATLRLELSLRARVQGRAQDLDAARVELDAVLVRSGVVVRLPVDCDRDGATFRIRGDVRLRDFLPADFDPRDRARLRLRLVWRNSVWQDWLQRPA